MNKLKYDYNEVKNLMAHERSIKHWTKKDLQLIQKARDTNNWQKVHKTDLYNKHGNEYCNLLQVLNDIDVNRYKRLINL